jgi:hypothetical protein
MPEISQKKDEEDNTETEEEESEQAVEETNFKAFDKLFD